jgi:hypothetical protein
MKKSLLFFSLTIIASVVHSQTLFVKLGPSFSHIYYRPSFEKLYSQVEKGMIGFDAIVGVNYLQLKYFNVSSGIGYITEGGSESYHLSQNDPSFPNYKIILNFLTVNTTFNFKVPIKNIVEPYVFAGPRLDYLASYTDGSWDLLLNYEKNGKLNKLIYGAIFGGGINVMIKRFRVGLDFDYYYNLNKLVDYEKKWGPEQFSSDVYAINAFFGYKF